MSNTRAIFFNDIEKSHVADILHETYVERIYQQFLGDRKDLTIMELGGNIGLATMFFYDYASKVYVLEPAKETSDILQTMLDYNKMNDKVALIRKAVSDKDGKATFYHSQFNTTANSLNPAISINNEVPEEVETIRMDTLFTQYKIDHVDFLNLDIEGAELDVICSEGFSKVADKIDSMLVEYHTWTGRNPSQLTTTLMDLGFEVYQIPSKAIIFGAKRKK